ncbi:phosphoglycerate mutase-like protein [Xylona heveae TC161]|uniref:Phosphoglycerate mutase-like protein n=1 Tax=Xylona heveae (strain CBS 132557 / TC161) TaxID=1328760 RepID=A0A164ZT88_XYLHT|nr:phosphoglycerate mutase-like protein [Xylona heveae TC161]KZF19482.1 phosphoglycerate mutase-like protein [Xylona heveae TC161]
MWFSTVSALVALVFLRGVKTQDSYKERVHASVIFTRHGERTPIALSNSLTLTPLGAQQMYQAGSVFRNRYVVNDPSSPLNAIIGPDLISGISTSLNNDDLYILSTDDEYVAASAQAFVQGLYPPTGDFNGSSINPFTESILANGTWIDSPLGGYQYPLIQTTSSLDPNSIWVQGDEDCTAYTLSGAAYYATSEFYDTAAATNTFYENLGATILDGVFQNESIGYYNAYPIYEYANYGYQHNMTIRSILLMDSDLQDLRNLASQLEFAQNGNLTADGGIRAMAGRTLASKALGLLANNIETGGTENKLNVMFGGFEPFLAFFALAQLPMVSGNFYGLPEYASSMVFELFSIDIPASNNQTYPQTDDLMVRFLFRNGTDENADMISYPLFGRGRSETDMSWSDFSTEMEAIALSDIAQWCNVCEAWTLFCMAYTSDNSTSCLGGNDDDDDDKDSNVTPQVAGVIGAAVTLGVGMIAFAIAMLLFGVRFHRNNGRRRSSGFGGFKGPEKMDSDADLTIVKNAAGVAVEPRTHERVGSWELSDSPTAAGGAGNAAAAGAGGQAPPRPERSWSQISGLQRNGQRHARLDDHDEDDIGVDPYTKPVRIDDRV